MLPITTVSVVSTGGVRIRSERMESTGSPLCESIAPFTCAHDLFGDGTLVLVPTPGHTAGSLSLLLRQDGIPPMLFVGDLCYSTELLERGAVPGVGTRGQLRESSRAAAELTRRLPGLMAMPAHDRHAAARLRSTLGSRTRTRARA